MVSITEIRELVRSKNYIVSHHAADELEDDNLTILDLESVIFTGRIIERQRDRNTDEAKHLIIGSSLDHHDAETIVKIGITGTLIFITVYVV